MFKTKIIKFSNNIIYFLALIILIFLFINNLFVNAYMNYSSAEQTIFNFNNLFLVILMIFLIILLSLIIKKFYNKKHYKYIKIVLFSLFIIFGLIWIFLSKSSVNKAADSEIIFNISNSILNKDYSAFLKGKYLYNFPYQIGLVFFEQILILLFKNNALLVFQLIALILIVISLECLIRIVNIITNNKYKDNIFIVIFLCLCFNLIFYCSFLYGNAISISLSIIAIYCYLLYITNTKEILNLILSILFISLSYMIKSTCLITIIALIIITFLYALKNNKYKKLIYIPILLLLFQLPLRLTFLYYQNIGDVKINSGIPKIGFVVMGTTSDKNTARAEGWYNAWHINNYLKLDCNEDKYKKVANKVLKENLNNFVYNPKYTVNFFYKKVTSMWNNSTFQSLWSTNPTSNNKFIQSLYKGNLNNIYYFIMHVFNIIVYFGSVIYLLMNKKITDYKLLPYLIFIGGFIFYLFWEGKAQYTFQFFLLLIPFASIGWYEFINKIKLKELSKKIFSIERNQK